MQQSCCLSRGLLMAACAMFTIPALIIFLIGQKFFIGGISAGAIK